jgi:hypothetical protein
LQRFPASILIGVDGKVVAKDAPVDELKELVRKELEK